MNSTPNAYQLKAQATRSRRSYTRPTLEQHKAYRRLLERNGEKNLTNEERILLSTHPYLAESQRLAMAASVNW